MQQQMLTFATGLKIYYFIDFEIFRAAAKQCRAQWLAMETG